MINDQISYPYRYVSKTSPEYPEALLPYCNMPSGIFVKGRLPSPGTSSVAIVGARKCTPYGLQSAKLFAKVLAQHGVNIISGMAYGTDSHAHKGAIEGGGKTFAVLGCGIDICYPKSNVRLMKNILETSGGIISEYPPGTEPYPYHFPLRNRIISALSDAVIIIEARIKSGSLITASYAVDQGKTVFAVPGKITDSMSAGTNSLIMQGAIPALSPDTVLYELGLKHIKKEEHNSPLDDPSLSEPEKKILKAMLGRPLTIDDICSSCHIDIAFASNILLNLELNGFVFQPVPGLYSVSYS